MRKTSPASDLRMAFGRNLRQLRIDRGLTQDQLATTLELALKNYQRLESGRHNPTLDTIGRLAAALQVHVSALFTSDAKDLPDPHSDPLPHGWRWVRQGQSGTDVCSTQIDTTATSSRSSLQLLGLAAPVPRRRMAAGQFLLKIQGDSMAPRVRDGDWVLFLRPVQPPWLGKVLLVEPAATDEADRWCLKRLALVEAPEDGGLRVRLDSSAPGFPPLWRSGADDSALGIVAELIEVLGPGSAD